MELGLENKSVFITASSAGIGKAIADRFVREGAVAIINGRNKDRLYHAIEELQTKYQTQHIYGIIGDMSEECDIERAKLWIKENIGNLDILIGNLGTGKPVSHDKLDITEWEHMYEKNLFATVKLIDRLTFLLKDKKNGSIVLVASLAAHEKIGAPPAYAAAKSGIASLIKYLSDDYYINYGIRINGVSPGNIFYKGGRWDELEKENPEKVHMYIAREVPMKRFGHPEEVADAVAFLASERASFITGTILKIDGGQGRGF